MVIRWAHSTISKKFSLLFAFLLVIVIASALVVDRSLDRLKGTGTQIDLSGSLRYLTRNMQVNAQHYSAHGMRTDLAKLEDNLTRFRQHISLLRDGGTYLGREIPPIPYGLQKDLSTIEAAFDAYEKELRAVMTASDQQLLYEERGEALHARASDILQAADHLTHDLSGQVETTQAEIHATLLRLVLIDGAILLAGLLVIRVQLVQPLRKLADASRRIAHGHYDERLGYSSGDEIGQLAASFNEMAGRIQQHMTEISRDNQVLRQTRDELHKFLLAVEHSPATVIITDQQGVIQYVNPKFSEVSGYAVAEAIGNRPVMLKSELTLPSVYREMWSAISSGRQWHGELLNRKKNGEMFWEDTWIGPILNDERKITHYIAIKQDVTEKKRIEQERARMNETLELRVAERTARLVALNKEQEAFSYSVSHDLRAPLRGIHGFAHLMIESCGSCANREALDYLGRIQRASLRMGEIIDDLLDLSSISRKEVRFERVLVNLLGNAWKFTAKRDGASIAFGSRMESGERVVFIRDNGAGFDMKYADKLFGAFQRLHGPHEFEGSGIGLATVQRIIYLRGGRIWAEGRVGQGATFYFALPETLPPAIC